MTAFSPRRQASHVSIPAEIWHLIFSKLPRGQLLKVARVNSSFRDLAEALLWVEPFVSDRLEGGSPCFPELNIPQTPYKKDWDRIIQTLQKTRKNVHTLDFQALYYLVDDNFLAQLASLAGKTLRTLRVYAPRSLSDRGLMSLTGVTKLSDLALRACTNISEKGLQALLTSDATKELRTLDLSDCRTVTDSTMSTLEGKRLERLVLAGNFNITLLDSISPDRLRCLDISHCAALERRSLESLMMACRVLQAFHAEGTPAVSDEVLLACPKSIQHVNVYGCPDVTDTGLEALFAAERLTYLKVTVNTGFVTTLCIQRLKFVHENVHVEGDMPEVPTAPRESC